MHVSVSETTPVSLTVKAKTENTEVPAIDPLIRYSEEGFNTRNKACSYANRERIEEGNP